MTSILLNIIFVILLIAADQGIKILVSNYLAPIGSVIVIPGIVELRYLLNDGMAFSMLSGKQKLLILATAIMLIGIAYYLFFRCKDKKLNRFASILILAGGIGNLIDRVLHGCVVDYINVLFMHFAVFNFADCCITIGVFLLIICILTEDNQSPKE